MKIFKEVRENFLLEVLKSSDSTSKYISDFVHSDNPKFKGKSKKERIRMALGAKYATMKKENNELVIKDLSTNDMVEDVYSNRAKRAIKYKELDHELRHEVDRPSNRAPQIKEPHSVHINGKKWKTFDTKNHAQNVANKIKGATVHKEKSMSEELVTKNNLHYCAKHVYSDIFGEGIVIEGEHAEPNESGNIEWYTVKFDHGNEIIFTEDLDILIAEYHKNHKKKNNKTNTEETLHPNQKKLDVAYPKGKLTADDFAKLRAMRKRK
jgi:hypothetical protein